MHSGRAEQSPSDLAELVFYRRRSWPDTLRRYVIVVDGDRRGLLARGRTLQVDVEPGPHTLQAKIDWMGSQPVEVSLSAGQELRISVSVAGGLMSRKLLTNSPLLVLTPEVASSG